MAKVCNCHRNREGYALCPKCSFDKDVEVVMEAIKVGMVNDCTVKVIYDEEPSNPRENDNIATLAHWHRRYNLGDQKIEVCSEEELTKDKDILCILPLYLYDHSGLSMSTGAYGCAWDSGQVGWAYISRDRAEVMGVLSYSQERLQEIIRAEVKEYDQYLQGQVYGYLIEQAGCIVDACYGFYDEQDCLAEGLSAAKHYATKAA